MMTFHVRLLSVKVNLGGTEIADAKIKIFKAKLQKVIQYKAGHQKQEKLKELDLAPGTYTFHEEAAPTGYLKVTDITFTVNHDGTVTVTKVGERKILKVKKTKLKQMVQQ